MTIPEKLIEVVLKTRGFQLAGFLLAASVVSLSKWPSSRSMLGLSSLEPHVGWFAVVGIACLCLLLGVTFFDAAAHRRETRLLRRSWIKRLKNLTEDEKDTLRRYMEQNVRTQHLSFSGGVATGLETKKIVYRASTLGVCGDHFAYNIQDGVFDILRTHPEYLAPTNPAQRRST